LRMTAVVVVDQKQAIATATPNRGDMKPIQRGQPKAAPHSAGMAGKATDEGSGGDEDGDRCRGVIANRLNDQHTDHHTAAGCRARKLACPALGFELSPP